MTRKLFLFSIVAMAYLLVRQWETRAIEHPPGILVPEAPVQTTVAASVFDFDEYRLTRMAGFELRARVLSAERYFFGRESDLSPIDLALGWGVMSDQSVLDRIDISQGARWYRTRYDLPAPVPDSAIIANSSNMHMIPADGRVADKLGKARVGDIVRLEGYLVNVAHESGWNWISSLRRDDTGAGACEVFYVEYASIE